MQTQRFIVTKNRPLSSQKISHFMLNFVYDFYTIKALYSRLITYNLVQKFLQLIGLYVNTTDKSIVEDDTVLVSGVAINNEHFMCRLNKVNEELKNINKTFC